MFQFIGTKSELHKYLVQTFTKKTIATMTLQVYAQSKTVQCVGTYKNVCDMLRLVYRESHLKTLQLDVCILQTTPESMRPTRTEGRVLGALCHEFPADLCMADVHVTAECGFKITAIKARRTLTSEGLREAKDYVEKYLDDKMRADVAAAKKAF